MKTVVPRIDSKLIFREDFRNIKTVTDNGGVMIGTPSISNGLTFTDTNTQGIKNKGVAGVTTKLSLILNDVTLVEGGAAYLAGQWSGVVTARSYLLYYSGTTLRFYVGDSTTQSYAYVALAAGKYSQIEVSYDGTGATDAEKIKIYVDNIEKSLSFSGTIMTSLNHSAPFYFGGYDNGSFVAGAATGTKIGECLLYTATSSSEELTDIAQDDTYSELDDSQFLLAPKLKSSYWKANGVALGTDYDMQAADTSAFTPTNSTLSKVLSDTPDGQKLVLRVQRDGSSANATQSWQTIGSRYKVTGWARGDGTNYPQLSGLDAIFVGTSSNTWQYIEAEYVATNAWFRLFSVGTNGNYVEYYGLRFERMEMVTGNNSLGGVIKAGDGITSTTFPTPICPHGRSFDGGDYQITPATLPTGLEAFSFAALMSFGSTSGTQTIISNYVSPAGAWFRQQSGDLAFYCFTDASNYIGRWTNSGGAKIQAGKLYFVGCSYDGSGTNAGLKIYLDEAQVDAADAALGTYTGYSLSNYVNIGAIPAATSPLSSGTKIYDYRMADFVLTPMQFRALNRKFRNALKI